MVRIEESEQIVEKHIAKGDIDAAVKRLYDMIVQSAKRKNFSKAEELRERILEIAPMALNEIINSAEIIEEEKRQTLNPIHMEIWSKLYNTLNMEEKNTIFFAMKEAVCRINQPIYSQGELNTNLYFIDSGKLNVMLWQKEGAVFLRTIGSGQIAGQDHFFSNTVCTTSLVAVSDVNVKYLVKKDLLEWKEKLPTLVNKLQDFCSCFQNDTELIKQKKINRRMLKRVNSSEIGVFQLLDRAWKPISRPFKGRLSDMSISGLAFEMRITNEATARLLLGRRLNIKCDLSRSLTKVKINQDGLIVGVRSCPYEGYSIHVKFDKRLDKTVFANIQRLSLER